jgi:hypothetical protein
MGVGTAREGLASDLVGDKRLRGGCVLPAFRAPAEVDRNSRKGIAPRVSGYTGV